MIWNNVKSSKRRKKRNAIACIRWPKVFAEFLGSQTMARQRRDLSSFILPFLSLFLSSFFNLFMFLSFFLPFSFAKTNDDKEGERFVRSDTKSRRLTDPKQERCSLIKERRFYLFYKVMYLKYRCLSFTEYRQI